MIRLRLQMLVPAITLRARRNAARLSGLSRQRFSAMVLNVSAGTARFRQLSEGMRKSMAASGRGSGVVGYNVQVAVDTEHHLIVTHEVTNTGSDRSQLAKVASQAKDIL